MKRSSFSWIVGALAMFMAMILLQPATDRGYVIVLALVVGAGLALQLLEWISGPWDWSGPTISNPHKVQAEPDTPREDPPVLPGPPGDYMLPSNLEARPGRRGHDNISIN